MSKQNYSGKVLSQNKKAFFEYEIKETFEAGISLLGPEVKSARLGGANLSESHIGFDGRGMLLFNMHISPYKYAPISGTPYDPTRNRRLLMHGDEITKISSKIKKGSAIIPLKLYFNGRQKIKVEIALAIGKKAHDKRRAIKERDLQREIRRGEAE